MTWTEAQSYCRETYTDLATIENTEEIAKLKDTISAAGHSSKVWIGLYTHINWTWSDGFNQSGVEYSWWDGKRDPNYHQANELCAYMRKSDEKLYDYDCNQQLPFVCYKGNVVLYIDLYDTT